MALNSGRLRGPGRRLTPEGHAPVGLRTERDVQAAYDLYGGELLGFASRALDDRQLAEDVVQETFVKAWRSPRGFDADRGSMRTWLFAIARNGIVDAIRRRRVRRDSPASSWDALSDAPSVLDPVGQLLEQIQVGEALRRLSPEHREAVVGVHYGGRTCAELADELEVPASTMRSRLYYGMRALRVVLEENGWLAS